MKVSRWRKISKVNFKQFMFLFGFLYFFFMYFFHSSIQLDKKEYYSDDDLRRIGGYVNSINTQISLQNEEIYTKAKNVVDDIKDKIESAGNRKSTDSSMNDDLNHDDFYEISNLAARSSSSYLNVQTKCLTTKTTTKSSSYHQSASNKNHSSVEHQSLPETNEPSGVYKSIYASQNASLSERERRYKNARMPFSEPSIVFSENDFIFQEVLPSFLVYSAFYDDRPNDFDNQHNGTHVRLMTALNSKGSHPPLYCVFDSEDGNKTLYASKAFSYEMCENHGKQFGGFILSCHVPIDLQSSPCFVTLYTKDPESTDFDITENAGIRVPVRTLTKSYLQNDKVTDSSLTNFTTCVPPLFGDIDPVQFIEFIEFSLASGIDKIIFYPLRIKRPILKILEYYALERKVVDIVPWNLPENYDRHIWYHGQLIAVQDCMYRNMALSSYIVFMDIDELLVPQMDDSLWKLVQTIDSDERCGFKFLGSYFEPYASVQYLNLGNLSLSNMVIPHSYHRTITFDKIRTKCILKPRLVFEQGIHHISKPIWSTLETLMVSTKIATLHHYRKCKYYGSHSDCSGKVKDESAFKFYSKAIRKAVKTIRLMSSRSVL